MGRATKEDEILKQLAETNKKAEQEFVVLEDTLYHKKQLSENQFTTDSNSPSYSRVIMKVLQVVMLVSLKPIKSFMR